MQPIIVLRKNSVSSNEKRRLSLWTFQLIAGPQAGQREGRSTLGHDEQIHLLWKMIQEKRQRHMNRIGVYPDRYTSVTGNLGAFFIPCPPHPSSQKRLLDSLAHRIT